MTKRAVIYIRISKDRANETSTETQEAEARALCERRGWTVATVEIDRGRSAYKADTNRPALTRTMRLLELGAADVLVVWKLDRLHRGIVDFWATWKRLDAAGAQLVSVTDDLDTTRAVGKMMVGLIAGFGEMESEVKSDRIKAWHQGRRDNRLPPAGPRPYGYDRVGDKLVQNKAEAKLVRTAATDVLNRGRSLRSIATEWGSTHRGVRHVLMSPTTSGRCEVGGVLIPGKWAGILDVATADAVRAALCDPTRRKGDTNERRWMLAGFAECACGGRLASKPHAAGPRYFCPICHCSMSAKLLDDHVAASLLAGVDRDRWQRARRSGRAPAIDTAALGSRLQEIAMDYAAGRVERDVYEAAKAEQARIIAESKAEPVELPRVDDLRAAWVDLLPEQKLLAVTAFIERVVLHPAARGERIEMMWRS